ncbi:MAG: TonB-dependent siderophore receptor, partial [Terriglobales bacterium]
FNETWTLQNRFLARFLDAGDVNLLSSGLRPDDRTLDRFITREEFNESNYTTNWDLTGKLSLWNMDHAILVGFDYLRNDEDFFFGADFENIDPALTIDIFNPTFGLDPNLFKRENIPFPTGLLRTETEWYGVYFQDHITLWDKLYLLGGGRYDWATEGGGCCEISPVLNERKDEEFSPRAGVLYQPWPWLGVYGSWAQSFGGNNGISASGEALPPETGEQYEVGLKTQLLDEQLTGTLAFYHLTRANTLTADLSTPDRFDSIAIGEARSQGIELDIAGRITDKLSLIGSYAFTDAEITKDNSGRQGNRLPNVPKHAGSLWLKYEVKGFDAPEGLTLGLGVFAAGRREGDFQNTFLLPGYARLDALAGYRWQLGPSRLNVQLNIRNLLDKEYFESADSSQSGGPPRTSILAGAPLTVLGSIRLEF